MTTELIVSDMTCNHCVQTITKAIHAIEPQADVSINLAEHKVTIVQVKDPQAIADVVREEGYNVKLI